MIKDYKDLDHEMLVSKKQNLVLNDILSILDAHYNSLRES